MTLFKSIPSSVCSLQGGFRERSCSNSSMAESVASLPCQPTSPARKVCVTAPVQKRQYQSRVPPTSQTNSMYELGCVYGSQPRRKQAETKSSWSTSNLSNSTVENNQCHYPSADIRASGDFGSSTSLSSMNTRTYNNMAQPYKTPAHFEKTNTSTPLHRNMPLESKERLLTFNSNAPVSPNHASVVKPIPRYHSSNRLSAQSIDTPVVAPVQSILAQRIAQFTQHGARSARPFVSRRAHTVDLATIQQRWGSAMQHARPRGSVSTVTEPVREKKKPWYNPAYDHQMLQLDHAMRQLREEIADVDVMLDRKSVAKTLDVNSNVTRSATNRSDQRSVGAGNIAVTAEPPIIISPAGDFNVTRGTSNTTDMSSHVVSRDATGVGGSDLSHFRHVPQQLRLAEPATEPLQRASSFDTADTLNKFRRVHDTADLSGRSGLKERVLPHKDLSLHRLAEPVVEPRQRASSFDTSQSKLTHNLPTAASHSRFGQSECIAAHNSVSPVFAPLERATSFDTSGTIAFPFATELSHSNRRQLENVLPHRSEPRHRLAEPFVSSPHRTSSFNRAGVKDGSMQNSNTHNKNARKGCTLSADHVVTIDCQPVPPDGAACLALATDVCASTRVPNTSVLDTLPVAKNHSSPSSPSSYFVPIDPLGDTTNSHSVVTDHQPVVVMTTPIKQTCTVDVSSLTNLFSPVDPAITEPYSSTAQSMTLESTPIAMATVPSVADSPVKSAFRRTDPNHRAKLVKQHGAPSNFSEGEPETLEADAKNLDKKSGWEEKFNRPDSPLATPLLLPKESIIIRNRCQRSDSSSSSNDYDSLSSPQRSPRMVRRKKLDKAHTLETIDRHGYLAVPGQR